MKLIDRLYLMQQINRRNDEVIARFTAKEKAVAPAKDTTAQ